MTVCIAALCWDSRMSGHLVVGAADRMLSAPDTEYEPSQSKIWSITKSIVAVGSGDTELLTELLEHIIQVVRKREQRRPGTHWELEEVARLYQAEYKRAAAARAEAKILAPLGLTMNSFRSQQKEMSDSLALQIATELWNFRLPDVEVIFTGTDLKGTHIYSSDNGSLAWRDGIGFAAIGAGSPHANSQMMFRGHSKWSGLSDTLLLVYSAKKRAEAAPGVGRTTDMFAIGPGIDSIFSIPSHLLGRLETLYQETQRKAEKAIEKSRRGIEQYLAELEEETKKTTQQQATTEQPASKSGL